jgi:hypothetical protein
MGRPQAGCQPRASPQKIGKKAQGEVFLCFERVAARTTDAPAERSIIDLSVDPIVKSDRNKELAGCAECRCNKVPLDRVPSLAKALEVYSAYLMRSPSIRLWVRRVKRFNGQFEVMLQSHHIRSGEGLKATLHRYVLHYNQLLPQSALGSKTPLQAVKAGTS